MEGNNLQYRTCGNVCGAILMYKRAFDWKGEQKLLDCRKGLLKVFFLSAIQIMTKVISYCISLHSPQHCCDRTSFSGKLNAEHITNCNNTHNHSSKMTLTEELNEGKAGSSDFLLNTIWSIATAVCALLFRGHLHWCCLNEFGCWYFSGQLLGELGGWKLSQEL